MSSPQANSCPRRTTLRRAAAAVVVASGLLILYRFEPSESSLFPPCMFHTLTGLHCPGCGSTRALHALIHGRVVAAVGYNPLMVLCLPWLIYVGASKLYADRRGRRGPAPLPRWNWTRWLPAAVIGFAVLRNLPWPPFNWLAP